MTDLTFKRKSKSTPFKLEHYRLLLRKLIGRGNVEFITYDDLAWQSDDDHRKGYPAEWMAWQKRLQSGELSSKTTYVLIQHDIDSGPQETLEMLSLENEYGVRSTTMAFNKWRDENEEGLLVDYPADFASMRLLEKQGFIFGYHCNAFHNTGCSSEGVYEAFLSDVSALREKLNIRFFSPHGGKTVNGVGNASFDYLSATNIDLKHVHNRYSAKFNSTFSDGGLIMRLLRSPDDLNFFRWVNSLIPGLRYRLLLHPQYFSDDNFQPLQGLSGSWYEKLITTNQAD